MSYHSGQDPEENLPDWLKALRKRQSQETPSSQEHGSASEEPSPGENQEEPDWLREIRERYGYPESQSSSIPNEEQEADLGDTQPVPVSRIERQDQSTEIDESGGEQITEKADSEETLDIKSQSEEPRGQEPPELKIKPEEPSREFPEWLQENAEPEETAGEKSDDALPHIPAFSEGTEEEIAPGELPSWLEAMRPGIEAEQEKLRPLTKSTSAGPLAGLSDVLPVEPIAAQPIKAPVYSNRIELTDRQSEHVAALAKILEEEDRPKEDQARQVSVPAYLLNSFMAAALIISVMMPLITQSRTAPLPVLSPEANDVFNIIEALPASSPVLIGFDLQPAQYGETRAVVSSTLNHLLDRQAQLVFISTQPTGPATAELLLQQELGTQPAVATKSYTNLGYLSGGMAALRSFFSNPRDASMSMTALGINPWSGQALGSIASVSDFALVVVITGSADDARVWIEQGSGLLSNGLIAVTSAQAKPALLPYIHGQPVTLRGIVSGIQGAAAYEQFRSQENGTALSFWASYSYGLGAIFLIALLGGLYGRAINLMPARHKLQRLQTPPDKPSASESQDGNES